jgi:RNA polymerase sigma-70 factor (ECF subfamily)
MPLRRGRTLDNGWLGSKNPNMHARPASWLSTRMSLLLRLKDADDSEGWSRFYELYGKVVFAVAAKSGFSPSDCDDIVQETILCVAKNISEFRYDPKKGSFKCWVLAIAHSRIVDLVRKRYRERRLDPARKDESSSKTSLLGRIPDERVVDVGTLLDAQWEREALETANERVRQKAKPRQYQLYDLGVRQEWSVEDITSKLGVTPNQVYLAKHRIGEAVAKELLRVQREAESICRPTSRGSSRA